MVIRAIIDCVDGAVPLTVHHCLSRLFLEVLQSALIMDDYDPVKKLGSGNFGVSYLMKHKKTGEQVAVKQIPRGAKINKNVYREVLNHRKLSHPNVIGFKAVHIDDTNLNIVMEFASGAFAMPLVHGAYCTCPASRLHGH